MPEEPEVSPRLLVEGCVIPTFTVRDPARTLASIHFASLPTRYPYTLMLPKSRTEAILASRLGELGGRIHRLEADLGASVEEPKWIVNGYVLSSAVLLMTAAALGDGIGRRRVFVAGLGRS